MEKARENRSYALDMLKIIATALVVLHHYQQVLDIRFPGHLNFYGGTIYLGPLVELFFLISGFLSFKYVADILNGQRFHVFFLGKARRLIPVMAVAAVCFELLFLLYFNIYGKEWLSSAFNFFGMVTGGLGLHVGWGFNDQGVNTPTWYCSILLMCYAVFFVVTYIAKRLRVAPAYFYIAMVFLGCGFMVFHFSCPQVDLPFLNYFSARGYYSFFYGLLLAMALDYFPLGRPLVWASLLTVLGLVYLALFHPMFILEGINYTATFIFFPAIIVLTQTQTAARIFRSRFIGTLSRISFDVYIWHIPVLMAVYVFIGYFRLTPDRTDMIWMYLFLLLTWAVGAVSHYALERPLDKLLKRLTRKLQAAAAEKKSLESPVR